MSAPAPQCQPMSDDADAPQKILRGWAKAYRDNPQYRFPSDPDAEFFPVDMEAAAARIEELEKALKPFADIAQYVVETQRDARPLTFGMDNVIVQRLTIGHLRKARAALQSGGAR